MVYFYGVSFTARRAPLQIEAHAALYTHRRHPADDFMALFVQESDSSIFSLVLFGALLLSERKRWIRCFCL
jgi:hypothetical protein